MAKKNNDSLSNFDYLDDIEKEFSIEEKKVDVKKEENRVEETANFLVETNEIEKTNTLKQGRPSGYFVQQFSDEIKQGGVKNITIYDSIHEQLHDLVYHISKNHIKNGKDRVTMLGVSVKALMIGMEQLKKEYGIK